MTEIKDDMIHEKNLPPRKANKFYYFEPMIADGLYDQLETGQYFKKYEAAIEMLKHENATQEDLYKVEADYIKKDLDICGQLYFQSYIPYPFYLAAVHNIMYAWSVIRHNWDTRLKAEAEIKNKVDDTQEVTEDIESIDLDNN